ncbi:MAG: response regulator [Halovenus sp.]
MTQRADTVPSVTVPRAVLRGSGRAVRDGPPLLRGRTSDRGDDESLEIPVPVAGPQESDTIRVLHVDDDPDVTELTGLLLERADEDFTVVGETSVVEGLNRLREEEFDCIVSDYDMPNTDGLEFLDIVRERYPDLPFVLFTAQGNEEIASEAIAAGATDYMQKGGGTEQYEVLANRIRNGVEQYRAQQRFWDALSWYQRLVEQDMVGVFVLQGEEFVYVNGRFADILGYTRPELIGMPPSAIAAGPEDRAAMAALAELEQTAGDEFVRTFTGMRADGTELPLKVQGCGPADCAGNPGCIGLLWRQDE